MNPAAIKSLTPCQAAGSTRSFWGYYPGTESRRGSQECPDTVLRTPLWTPLEVVVPHKDTWTPGHHPLANCPPGLRGTWALFQARVLGEEHGRFYLCYFLAV